MLNQKNKKSKKKIVAATWEALIYYTWQVRNSKVFRQQNVQMDLKLVQIQRELCERLYMLNHTKRAGRCQALIGKQCN